jgi:hypothetical protein
MSAITTNLNEILIQTREMTAQNLRTLAVFDLDSTLFNVSTRTQKIINEFAELHNITELGSVIVRPEDWGIKEALLRAGFSAEKNPEVALKLKNYWSEKFFSDEYLHYDVPYYGAIAFVLELHTAGAEVYYLTGRDQKRMAKGSMEVLKKWGFPVQDSTLFLKPEKSQDDELFKHDWFTKLDKTKFSKIYFFENEPININAILDNHSEVEVIFLDTTHARKQEVTVPVKKIKHFGRGEKC